MQWVKRAWGTLTMDRWISAKLGKARRGTLEETDFHAQTAEEKLYWPAFDLWAREAPYSMMAIVQVYWRDVLLGLVYGFFTWALQILAVYFFFQMIAIFLADPTQSAWFGWMVIVLFGICNILGNFAVSLLGCHAIWLGTKVKNGLMATVYRKAMTLQTLEDTGLISNLVSNGNQSQFTKNHI